jgi:hypothetical protein
MGNFRVKVSSSQCLVTVRKLPARRTQSTKQTCLIWGESKKQESLVYSDSLMVSYQNNIKVDLKYYQDSSKIPLLELPVPVRLSFWSFRVAVASSMDVHDGILTLTFASWASPCMYD